LSTAAFAVAVNAQVEHTLVQYNDSETFLDSTPLCQSETPGEPVVNHNSRLFHLEDYGITSDFTITKVDFVASALPGTNIWAEVAEVNGEFVADNMIVGEGYGSFTYPTDPNEDDGNAKWRTIEMLEPYQVIPAGQDFA